MLQIQHLTITHRRDLRTILSDFSFILNRGDKAVLIGEEGNGKSTLLKWIYDPALVESYADAEGVRSTQGELLAYLPQELAEEDKNKSVREYFAQLPAGRAADPADFAADSQHGAADPGYFVAEPQHQADPARLRRLAAQLHFPEALLTSAQTMGSLSGGERVKVQLAGLLLAEPDFLLLDEPSNDIDLDTLLWLERTIRDFPGGVLFISHDETLIERTANRVVLLEQLRRKTVPRATVANVPFRTFMDERARSFAKQEQEALSERRDEQKARDKFQRIQQAVETDLRNISRRNPSGGRLLKKKMKAVKSMERRYEREHEEMTALPEAEAPITIRFEQQKAMPAGKTVIELELPELIAPGAPEPAERNTPERTAPTTGGRVLARNISLRVRGPEKICLIGRNGAGKTTLLRRIADELCRRSDLTACYMPQHYEDALPMEQTPLDYLAPSGRKDELTAVRTYLGSLKYTAEEMFHPIRELSGGQKAKLLLLKMSLTAADVLILDEPTRNFSPLSAPEVRAILRDFPGAILSVSHDRKYIAEVCDKIYELTPEGLVPATLPQ